MPTLKHMLSVQRLATKSRDFQDGYLDGLNGADRRPVFTCLRPASIIQYDNGYDTGQRERRAAELIMPRVIETDFQRIEING